jgi:acetoacetyl-CoA synthetase
VPDEIVVVAEVPYTLSGKKIEVPIKRIITGEALPAEAVSVDSLRNPDALKPFLEFAGRA